ncbi:MAG: S41 family peptidase [Myxococcota bacterium]
MTKLRTIGSVGIVTAVSLGVLLGVANLKSFAGPSYQELALVTNVLHLVQQHYVKEVDEHELVEGALKGMLDVLDPHTSYLSKDLFKEVQLDTKGEFEGLGIEITKRDGYVTVVAPIDGTPAARAGIRARDQIVAVCPSATESDCQSTQEMNLIEAVKLMRGRRGTKVMIMVLREGWTTPKPFVIKRDSIRVSSVKFRMIEPGLPFVRLSQFQERTAQELQEALEKAHEDVGAFTGLVLDLRDNPGGLLDQAVRVADLFLGEGLIVFSEGRGGGNRMEWHAHAEGTEPEFPIVVLVNGGSASASEIVAGALQDHNRALVLGNETFGKGSVQTIIPLEDGSGLRLTTALYYLPSGRSIQEVRIQPDVEVDAFSEAEIKSLESEEERKSFGEEDLLGHIRQEGEEPREEAEPSQADEFARQMLLDRQLTRAIDLLKSWTIFSNLKLGSDA